MNTLNYSRSNFSNKHHLPTKTLGSSVLKQIIIIAEIGWYLNNCPEPKDIFLKKILKKIKNLNCEINDNILDDLISSNDIITKFNNFFKTLSIIT